VPRQVLLYQSVGRGGAGDVQLGKLVGPYGFTKLVAVKRLRVGAEHDGRLGAMLIDEARLGAHVRSPNVVSTLELIEHEGDLYVVMEYIHGESLSRLLMASLGARALVPVPIALAIGCGMLRGLEAVHTARDEHGQPLHAVHRDVSPQNLLVGLDGVTRVVDFGIAKARGRLQETDHGEVKGKLGYMSPEQASGASVDHRTDVYSAAVVLWEALVGDRLFLGQTETETLGLVLAGPVAPPSARRPEVPAAIDDIILRGLSREREARWASAALMAEALEASLPLASSTQVGQWVEALVGNALEQRLARLSATATPTAVLTPRGAEPPPSSTPVESRKPVESSPRRRFRWWPLPVAGLVVLLAPGLLWLRQPWAASPPTDAQDLGVEVTVPSAAPATPDGPDAGLAAEARPSRAPRDRRRPDCRVPYSLDEKGHKRFRPECL